MHPVIKIRAKALCVSRQRNRQMVVNEYNSLFTCVCRSRTSLWHGMTEWSALGCGASFGTEPRRCGGLFRSRSPCSTVRSWRWTPWEVVRWGGVWCSSEPLLTSQRSWLVGRAHLSWCGWSQVRRKAVWESRWADLRLLKKCLRLLDVWDGKNRKKIFRTFSRLQKKK